MNRRRCAIPPRPWPMPSARHALTALQPIADTGQALGATPEEARLLMVDTFAHAAGLLLFAHTGRIRMFGASAPDLMQRYVESRIAGLVEERESVNPCKSRSNLRKPWRAPSILHGKPPNRLDHFCNPLNARSF